MALLLDDDPEFRALLAAQRRYGFRRAIVMGLIALAAALSGLAAVAYGRTLDVAQAHAEVRFLFPSRLQFIGWTLVVVGSIATVACFTVAARIGLERRM